MDLQGNGRLRSRVRGKVKLALQLAPVRTGYSRGSAVTHTSVDIFSLFPRAIPILLYLSVYNLVFVTCTMSIESHTIMYRIFCRPSRADVADVAQAAKTLTLEAKR